MPLYEYECFLCRHRFERIQRVADEPVSTCPECGGAVRRLLGTPALQFKGGGWYITDYGSGRSSGKTSAADGGDESTTSSKAANDGADASPTAGSKDDGNQSDDG